MNRNSIKVFAKARPGALPVPADRRVSAFTKPDVFDRWSETSAEIRPVAAADANVIQIFGSIGEDYWAGTSITARTISQQLQAIGAQPVEVQINSGGGDMFEGIAIYNVLREHPEPVTVKVMGMAASAASIIAMAGDVIEIGAASFMMIHNCWVMAIGNRHDMADTALFLAPFDKAMADLYAARTGMEPAQTAALMDAETYLSGSQAVEQGFADSLLAADQVRQDEPAASTAKDINALRSMELTLVSAGRTRAEARAQINKIKGTPGAAPAGTPGAAATDWADAAASLLKTLKT